MNNNKKTIESVQVRFLNAGDVLGSGFVVTHKPSRGLRTPRGKVDVWGYYPGDDKIKSRQWGAYTIVQIVRD